MLNSQAVTEYENTLSTIGDRLNETIVEILGEDADWENHVSSISPPPSILENLPATIAPETIGKLWLAREEANSVLNHVGMASDDEITQREQAQIREAIAAVQHDQIWGRWTKYQFSKCIPNPDGSITIPAELVQRWTRQANTLYVDLPESERESDRHQADKVLIAIVEAEAKLIGGDDGQKG
jgi:hypothetical protein